MELKTAFLIDMIGASLFAMAAMFAVIVGSRAPGAAPATVALMLFAFAFAFSLFSNVLAMPGASSGGAIVAFAGMVAAMVAGIGFAVAAVAVSI